MIPQGAAAKQGEPKKQRTPRKRKTKNEWQLNQQQLKQNKSQEISHISPGEQVVIPTTTHKENTRGQKVLKMW